jgi:hypothetical protein
LENGDYFMQELYFEVSAVQEVDQRVQPGFFAVDFGNENPQERCSGISLYRQPFLVFDKKGALEAFCQEASLERSAEIGFIRGNRTAFVGRYNFLRPATLRLHVFPPRVRHSRPDCRPCFKHGRRQVQNSSTMQDYSSGSHNCNFLEIGRRIFHDKEQTVQN